MHEACRSSGLSLAFRAKGKPRAEPSMAKAKKKKKPARSAKGRKKKAIRAAKSPKKKSPLKTVRVVPAAKPDQRRRHAKSLVRRAHESTLRPMARLVPRLGADKYDLDLERNPANYQQLTPLTFLERCASVFPTRTAIIHGKQRFSYADYYARARRLASALAKSG